MTVVIDGGTVTVAKELEGAPWDDRRVDPPTGSGAIFWRSLRMWALSGTCFCAGSDSVPSIAILGWRASPPTERASWRQRAVPRVE